MVTTSRHGTWMDGKGCKKTCIKEKGKKGSIHQPFYGTWVADFMLRQDAGKFMLAKYLSDKQMKRLGMAVARITPTSSQLTKIGKMQSAVSSVAAVFFLDIGFLQSLVQPHTQL